MWYFVKIDKDTITIGESECRDDECDCCLIEALQLAYGCGKCRCVKKTCWLEFCSDVEFLQYICELQRKCHLEPRIIKILDKIERVIIDKLKTCNYDRIHVVCR